MEEATTGDFVRMYVEDDDALGPAAFPISLFTTPPDPILGGGIVTVPVEQAKRWEAAEEAWLAAQAEMRVLLRQRRNVVLGAVAQVAGFDAAHQLTKRGPGRARGRGRQ